jgi:histidine ammonia-lyase
MLQALSVLVATELVVAVRALRIAGRTPAGAGVRAVFAAAAASLPDDLADRAFGRDVEAARDVLAERSAR